MGLLNYSVIGNLTAGQPERVADVVTSLNEAKTIINGNIDGANAPGLKSQYQVLDSITGLIVAGQTAGTYIQLFGSLIKSGVNTVPFLEVIPITAAAWAVTGLTTKLRLRARATTNAAAPAVDFTCGLYPFTPSGASSSNLIVTVGTVVAGSTAAIVAPSAGAISPEVSSGDFSLPADGGYVIGIVMSGTAAANSTTAITTVLEYRNV